LKTISSQINFSQNDIDSGVRSGDRSLNEESKVFELKQGSVRPIVEKMFNLASAQKRASNMRICKICGQNIDEMTVVRDIRTVFRLYKESRDYFVLLSALKKLE